MALRNDEPVLCDMLDRTQLVREVAELLANSHPPQVYGVHGDWGLGKTSFLHQVQLYLTGQCGLYDDTEVNRVKRQLKNKCGNSVGRYREQLCVVWFEAWRYQYEPAPVVALLQEMRSQLTWQMKTRRKIKKLTHVAARSALMNAETITKMIGIQASKIQQEGERWESSNLAETLPSNVLREQLESAIRDLLTPITGNENSRVVVIVDDLDRCAPQSAYLLLEGLKVYLTLPNCVFLLGMNQQIMEDAIGKYVPLPKDGAAVEAERAERAAAYLEKVCQNVWRLPLVADPKQYLLSQIDDTLKVVKQWIDAAIGDLRCLPPNPRRLKGLANLLVRFSSHLPKTHGSANDEAMIREARLMLIVAYVYQFHHDLFRLWESNPDVHRHLLDWVRGQHKPSDESPLERILSRLHFAEFIHVNQNTPTPSYTTSPAFPDPTDTAVFWIQSLIHEAAVDANAGRGSVESEAYSQYIHGKRLQSSDSV